MSPSRKTEIKRMMRAHERPPVELVLVLHDVEDPVNVGAAFRVADALKVSELVLTGISACPPHKLITKVGRAKDQRVRWRHVEDVETALQELAARGFQCAAVEITPDAVPYYTHDFPAKVALVVGHEDHGVTKKALARCPVRLFIPTYGKGASLNVHVALSVVAFHVLHREAALGAEPPSC